MSTVSPEQLELWKQTTETFVALDFETADYGRDSACSIGMVRVEQGRIRDRAHRLIRPPRKAFVFEYYHGISWTDVAEEPTFRRVWSDMRQMLDGAEFIAAHNASFDRGVLHACCRRSKLTAPSQPFVCTVSLAKQVLGFRRAPLDEVCRRLKIRLRHHHALSDAEACARIVLEARKRSSRIAMTKA